MRVIFKRAGRGDLTLGIKSVRVAGTTITFTLDDDGGEVRAVMLSYLKPQPTPWTVIMGDDFREDFDSFTID